jgi:hypothetical protein
LEGFYGHVLLSFMTAIVYLKLMRTFHGTKFNPVDFMAEMRGLACTVYENPLQAFEPTARQKEILKILKTEIPTRAPLPV